MHTEKATIEHEPKIAVDFYFSPHFNISDFEKMESLFEKADVYCPELGGWCIESEEILNAISFGAPESGISKIKFASRQLDALYREIAHVIHESQKPIILVDEPTGGESYKYYQRADEFFARARMFFLRGEFELFMKFVRGMVAMAYEGDEIRHRIIRENLESRIREVAPNYETLKNKSEIRALVSLGIGHTHIARTVSKDMAAHSTFSTVPFVFSSEGQAERLMDVKKPVPEALFARIGVEWLIHERIFRFGTIEKVLRVTRYFSKQFTLEDCKALCKAFGPHRFDRESAKKSIFDEELQKRAIIVPQTAEEFKKVLDDIAKKDRLHE